MILHCRKVFDYHAQPGRQYRLTSRSNPSGTGWVSGAVVRPSVQFIESVWDYGTRDEDKLTDGELLVNS